MNFIKAIEIKIKSQNETPNDYVLVLDNHSAHHSLAVRGYTSQIGLKLLFSAPTASEFNPIESKSSLFKMLIKYSFYIVLWHHFKQAWRKVLWNPMFKVTEQNAAQFISLCLLSISHYGQNLAKGPIKLLKRYAGVSTLNARGSHQDRA
jgi:hypothetical protein